MFRKGSEGKDCPGFSYGFCSLSPKDRLTASRSLWVLRKSFFLQQLDILTYVSVCSKKQSTYIAQMACFRSHHLVPLRYVDLLRWSNARRTSLFSTWFWVILLGVPGGDVRIPLALILRWGLSGEAVYHHKNQHLSLTRQCSRYWAAPPVSAAPTLGLNTSDAKCTVIKDSPFLCKLE